MSGLEHISEYTCMIELMQLRNQGKVFVKEGDSGNSSNYGLFQKTSLIDIKLVPKQIVFVPL